MVWTGDDYIENERQVDLCVEDIRAALKDTGLLDWYTNREAETHTPDVARGIEITLLRQHEQSLGRALLALRRLESLVAEAREAVVLEEAAAPAEVRT